MTRWLWFPILALAIGCGGGDGVALAPVSGTVTMDGEPLAGAQIAFFPKEAWPILASAAVTDEEGNYRLEAVDGRSGAMPGNHRVTVLTGRSDEDEEGNIVVVAEETIPQAYRGVDSLLAAEVVDGSNTIDFSLSSSGAAP